MGALTDGDVRRMTGMTAFLDRVSKLSGVEQEVILDAMRKEVYSKQFCSAWYDHNAKVRADSASVQSALKDNTVPIFGPIVSQGDADIMRKWYGTEDYTTVEMVMDRMGEIEGDVEMLVNSPGGDVTAASAIRRVVQERVTQGDHVVFNVFGIAASAASFVAMDAQESVISDMATYMIHNCNMEVFEWKRVTKKELGVLIGKWQSFEDWMEQTDDVMVDVYVKRSGLERDEVIEMMDKETYLMGEKAVEKGFIDRVYQVASGKKEEEKEEASAKGAVSLEEKMAAMDSALAKLKGDFSGEFPSLF